MLAETIEAPFDSDEWIFEIKFDGYRAIAGIQDGKVDLYSRNLLSFNEKYPAIAEELRHIKHNVVLDGEIVVEDKNGRSGFQLLQNNTSGTLKYYVFDLLHLNGYDLYKVPLLNRKELLKTLLEDAALPNVIYSSHIEAKGVKFYKTAMKRQLEGIMAKKANSLYQPDTRTSEWLKIKIVQQQEMVIAGLTEPQGSRKHFGSLILAVNEKGAWKYSGHVGTGFNESALGELYRKAKPYFTEKSPFKEKVKVNAKVQWLRPQLVCQVKFTEWTNDGHLRHPVYLGLRKDKKASEVRRERTISPRVINDKEPAMKKTQKKTAKKTAVKTPAAKASKTAKASNEKTKPEETVSNTKNYDLRVGKTVLHLTNQEKIYWPEEGYRKKEVISYYDAVSSLILPYLKNRPQSMHRFPDGIKGQAFYQKDVDRDKIPSWLQTEKVYSDSTKEYIDYLICNDKATLLYMANLGCIEINPWNSRIGKVENPDWAVIDLDPEAVSFKEVVHTALEVKKTLDELEIESFCKTSGATGLHIYIPLAAKYDYETSKTFAELIAHLVNKKNPETTSIVRSPSKRQGKVYLDFLQNHRGQTLAAPYSIRPKPGATVSTPLLWKEVNAKLDPSQFTIKTIFKRLDKTGDLWKPVLGKGYAIHKALEKLQARLDEEAEEA